jgi:hypothetical protein
MQIITIGRRVIAADQIAVIEPFDPASNPEFQPEKEYKARIVLLNRDTVLTEITTQEFAAANGFYLLSDEAIAVSSSLAFGVESFTPTEKFKPEKAYRSRIKWRDPDGNEQSKLLLMEPETVVLELSRRGSTKPDEARPTPRRPARRRRARLAEATK